MYEFTGTEIGIKKRQIFEDIKFMESAAGYSIDLLRLKDGKKVYYRYLDTNFSINSQPLNEAEANQLKEALFTLGRFKGLPQFNWIGELTTRLESSFSLIPNKKEVIHFEQNEYLKGLDFNRNISFNGIFSAPFTLTANVDRNESTLSVPVFNPLNYLNIPSGATHFRIINAVF